MQCLLDVTESLVARDTSDMSVDCRLNQATVLRIVGEGKDTVQESPPLTLTLMFLYILISP